MVIRCGGFLKGERLVWEKVQEQQLMQTIKNNTPKRDRADMLLWRDDVVAYKQHSSTLLVIHRFFI